MKQIDSRKVSLEPVYFSSILHWIVVRTAMTLEVMTHTPFTSVMYTSQTCRLGRVWHVRSHHGCASVMDRSKSRFLRQQCARCVPDLPHFFRCKHFGGVSFGNPLAVQVQKHTNRLNNKNTLHKKKVQVQKHTNRLHKKKTPQKKVQVQKHTNRVNNKNTLHQKSPSPSLHQKSPSPKTHEQTQHTKFTKSNSKKAFFQKRLSNFDKKHSTFTHSWYRLNTIDPHIFQKVPTNHFLHVRNRCIYVSTYLFGGIRKVKTPKNTCR